MGILIDTLLTENPAERPHINLVLAFPSIKQKRQEVLSQEVFLEEFAHTVLHNRDVFAEYKK